MDCRETSELEESNKPAGYPVPRGLFLETNEPRIPLLTKTPIENKGVIALTAVNGTLKKRGKPHKKFTPIESANDKSYLFA
jgi:hypothetical protein